MVAPKEYDIIKPMSQNKIDSSRFHSRKEWEEFLWRELLRQISRIKSTENLDGFLQCFISKHERNIMLKRLTALMMLKEGKSYREIGRLLWISPSTLSALRRSALLNPANYVTRREREKSKQRMPKKRHENIFGEIKNGYTDSILANFLEAVLEGKSNMRARWKMLR